MKLPLFSNMREAAQKLMKKNASSTVQQTLDSLRQHPSMRQAAPASAPAQPSMRDINPPPARSAAEAAAAAAAANAAAAAPEPTAKM